MSVSEQQSRRIVELLALMDVCFYSEISSSSYDALAALAVDMRAVLLCLSGARAISNDIEVFFLNAMMRAGFYHRIDFEIMNDWYRRRKLLGFVDVAARFLATGAIADRAADVGRLAEIQPELDELKVELDRYVQAGGEGATELKEAFNLRARNGWHRITRETD